MVQPQATDSRDRQTDDNIIPIADRTACSSLRSAKNRGQNSPEDLNFYRAMLRRTRSYATVSRPSVRPSVTFMCFSHSHTLEYFESNFPSWIADAPAQIDHNMGDLVQQEHP